ncbi:retrovirus-related pol polyprotein from transposon TNT 1-94 [Tanacetum coccineum]
MRGEQLQLKMGEFRTDLAMQILVKQSILSGGQDNTFDDDVDEPPVQDLALNVDQVFQTNQCDAFDSDIYEAPTAHTMFMANLSSTDPIYDEASPSYDSDILSEVQDHDNFIDSVGNSQVKDNKIDLLVQQYEQFVISEDESIDSAFARFNTIITSLKSLDEGYSSKNYVRKFLRALHPKWRAKVTAIEDKVEKEIACLKAKKESSDGEECSTSSSEGRRVAMARSKSFLIGECPKPPRDKNQRAFVGGSWSDSGEEDDEKIQDETCLVAQAPNEVCSESSYFSDENSSIDDLALDNEYDKLCKMSLMIITKNKRLKAIRNSLENELRELKDRLSTLEKNKGVDLDCAKCHTLKIENEKLKEESTRLNKFEKSTHCLNEMLSNQKPSGDKLGLGFNSFEASSSGTKKIKFVKAQKKICLGVDLEPDEWIKDIRCSKDMTGNQKLFSTYKAYNGGNIIFGSNLHCNIIGNGKICDNKCRVTLSEHDSEIIKDGKVIGRGIRKKGLYVMKLGNKSKDEIFLATIDENSTLWHSPSSVRSYGGNRYTLVIVDDYSRTLQEMSRTMLKEQSLLQKFWCNAVDTSRYILNRILIRTILGKTPYELLRGRKPTLNYFRVFGSKCFILNTKDYLTKFDPKSYKGVFLGYSQNSKACIILNKHTKKIEESLNVTFDETPPPSKTLPLVDDDLDEEEAIRETEKKNLENVVEDETLEIDEIVNIKESRNHPLENVIGNLNQRTLRSQAQNQSNFYCFISTIEPKNVNEALGDESWIVAMQEELN